MLSITCSHFRIFQINKQKHDHVTYDYVQASPTASETVDFYED